MPKTSCRFGCGNIDGVEEKLSQSSERPSRPSRGTEPDSVEVRIPAEADEEETLAALREIFHQHRGNAPVLIYLQNGQDCQDWSRRRCLSDH